MPKRKLCQKTIPGSKSDTGWGGRNAEGKCKMPLDANGMCPIHGADIR